jgi:hypothetical protein
MPERGRKPVKSIQSLSRSASRKEKHSSPVHYTDARTKLYEAKFEKYLNNKDAKDKQEKRLDSMKKEDFDRYTKDEDSPAKSANRFKSKVDNAMS